MADLNNNTTEGKIMSIRQKFGNDDIAFFQILGASFMAIGLSFLFLLI